MNRFNIGVMAPYKSIRTIISRIPIGSGEIISYMKLVSAAKQVTQEVIIVDVGLDTI